MDINAIFDLITSAAIGVMSFFLKRSYDKLDNSVTKAELQELKEKIENADERYASKSELNELKRSIEKMEKSIEFLRENTVRSNDFVRTMTRLETKLDDIRRDN